MKLIFTSLLLCLIAFTSFGQATWENFDDPAQVSYFFVNGGLNQGFENPTTDGINSSALCGEYVRSNQQFDVIVIEPNGIEAVEDVNPYVEGTKTLSMKVLSPAPGITVQITLENSILAAAPYPAGRHSEYFATTTTSGEWEELTFEFANLPDVSMTGTEIDRLVILFAPGTLVPQTFLWDDLMGPDFSDPCAGVEQDLSILEDFECQRNVTYEFANGDLLTGFENPDMTGVNTSATCAQFTKFPPPTDDGAFGGDFEGTFTSLDYSTVSIDLYSTEVLNFLVIFQNSSEANLIEQTFTTSGAGVWETFSADLSAISPSEEFDRVVLLLNPGSPNADVILLDNLKLSNDDIEDPCEGVVENLAIFDDFECQRNLSYDFANGTLIQNAVNPSQVGNESPTCGQFIKFLPPTNDGAFGGDFEGSFTVFDYSVIYLDLYSEEVLEFKVIFQSSDLIDLFEQTFTTAGESTWETFMADFSSVSPSLEIDQIVFLLNPESETEDQIFIDNIRVDEPDNVIELDNSLNIRTFPIPFNDQLEVISSENMEHISVIDMVGKEVLSLEFNNTLRTKLETSELPAGNYMLVITSESGATSTKKIIK